MKSNAFRNSSSQTLVERISEGHSFPLWKGPLEEALERFGFFLGSLHDALRWRNLTLPSAFGHLS
jgi:hypothetical protein